MNWRWDQGRLEYFLFENIRNTAIALYNFDSASLEIGDPLREPLQIKTRLKFLPLRYTVWRNYKRVFGCSLLATSLEKRIILTDIAKLLVENHLTADDYFSLVIPRFYFPSPIFENYQLGAPRSFPFCALIRYLVFQPVANASASISLDEAFSLLIANKATGAEPQDYYLRLKPKSITPSQDEKRQVREMLIFFSQFSPLKWINGKLVLDVAREEPQAREALIRLATPLIREQQTDRAAELLRVASVKVTDPLNEILNFLPAEQEEETLTLFREGRRVMAYHNRIERSQNLRRLFMRSKYFRKNCDMCVEDLKVKYPWTDRLFEVHHILPLASPLWLSSKGVSLEDVRGICPNCHRGVHRFYVKYLTGKKQPDFSNHEEARDVYTLAKTRVNRFKPA